MCRETQDQHRAHSRCPRNISLKAKKALSEKLPRPGDPDEQDPLEASKGYIGESLRQFQLPGPPPWLKEDTIYSLPTLVQAPVPNEAPVFSPPQAVDRLMPSQSTLRDSQRPHAPSNTIFTTPRSSPNPHRPQTTQCLPCPSLSRPGPVREVPPNVPLSILPPNCPGPPPPPPNPSRGSARLRKPRPPLQAQRKTAPPFQPS